MESRAASGTARKCQGGGNDETRSLWSLRRHLRERDHTNETSSYVRETYVVDWAQGTWADGRMAGHRVAWELEEDPVERDLVLVLWLLRWRILGVVRRRPLGRLR